jgi:acetyl-CoA carboxylase biotin carboxyl carrier protein
MNSVERIQLLNRWLDGTDIAVLELTTPRDTVRLRRGAMQAAPPPAIPQAPAPFIVTAPSLGVFLHRHPLHAAPAAVAGQTVQAGAMLGVLRIGKLMLEVTAPGDGVVEDITAADGGIVGYGAALVRMSRDT